MLLHSVKVLWRHKSSSARSLHRVGLILLTLTTQLKSSISHSSKGSHVYTSVRRTKNFWRSGPCLSSSTEPSFHRFGCFAAYCDTLGSHFPCYLVDLAAPAKNDTRMDAHKDFVPRSRRPPWLSFSLRMWSQELMCLDGRPAIQ